MYRAFLIVSVAVLLMFAYASCASWDTVSEERTNRAQIDADARVRIAEAEAGADSAEGQALLQAAQAANQTAQMQAQQNTQNMSAFASTLLAVTQQNSALTSQIIASKDSVPTWVTGLIIFVVVLTVVGIVIGTIALYTASRTVRENRQWENRPRITSTAVETRAERLLANSGVPFRRSGDYLVAVVDGETVRVPNV